jgi:hypothetical protein
LQLPKYQVKARKSNRLSGFFSHQSATKCH